MESWENRIRYETGLQARGGGGEEGTGVEWEIGGLSLSGCLCCRRARMPGCEGARKGAGGRWAQRDGVWIRGEGQGSGNWQPATGKGSRRGHLGRAGGQEGPMREATGNLVPVQGEDARPSYPWSPTLMPDRPISLRPTSSTPRLSTVLKAYGRSVSLSVSVRLWRSIPFWPSLESGSLSIRTGQHRLNQVLLQEQSVRSHSQTDYIPGRTDIEASCRPGAQGCLLSSGRVRSRLAAFVVSPA